MGDSYIYTLPETTDPAAADFTVVDTYVGSVDNFITKKVSLNTVAHTISASIVQPLTSWLPIDSWNSAHTTLHSMSTEWTAASNVVVAGSANWNATYNSTVTGVGAWNNTSTIVDEGATRWNNTDIVVSALVASCLSGGSSFIGIVEAAPTTSTITATAYGEYILVNVGGLPRAIQLWQY